MTDAQKLFFALGLLAVISLCLVPPWLGKAELQSGYRYAGHRLIFYTGPSVSAMDSASYRAFEEKTRHGKKLYGRRLALEIGAIISISSLLILVNRKKKTAKEKQVR
jgi:hypothetical protein